MHQFLPRLIVGFHGTSESAAKALVGESEFRRSEGPGEWLGNGVYFWLNDPVRARTWAEDRYGPKGRISKEKSVVLGAIIDPGNCLDLTTKEGLSWLKLGYEQLESNYKAAGVPMLENTTGFERPLDKAVIEQVHSLVEDLIASDLADGRSPRVRKIDTVMNVYPDGKPIYPGTALLHNTHTQICVRDPKRIIGVFRVKKRLFTPKRMDGLV